MTLRVLGSALEAEEAFGPIVPVTVMSPGSGFQMRTDGLELGDGIGLHEFRLAPLRVRTRNRAIGTGPDVLLFCVHVDGPGRVLQHDRAAELTRGAGVLYEARSPFEIVYPERMTSVTLTFPRELLPVRSGKITEFSVRTLSARAPAMRLLAGYLGQLGELAPDLTAGQRGDAVGPAIELLEMAMRDMDVVVPGGDAGAEVLLGMMCQHIRGHLGDRRLSVAELARRHHVSERHVHALFARIGATPGGFIREQRLLAARSMLANPGNDTRSVADIAAVAGFAGLTTFERAFRRQYGMTPGRWRREHRAASRATAG
jgi:AraC-like DNA-binding protein